jgi:hypothetical protein
MFEWCPPRPGPRKLNCATYHSAWLSLTIDSMRAPDPLPRRPGQSTIHILHLFSEYMKLSASSAASSLFSSRPTTISELL